MKKLALLLIIPCALLLVAQTASAQNKTMAPASTHKQMKATTQLPTVASRSMWDLFRPETVTGTMSIIEPGKRSLFVSTSSGVSFHFVVTGRTRIRINGTPSTIAELAQQVQKQATVSFVARPSGDIAQSITVSS